MKPTRRKGSCYEIGGGGKLRKRAHNWLQTMLKKLNCYQKGTTWMIHDNDVKFVQIADISTSKILNCYRFKIL